MSTWDYGDNGYYFVTICVKNFKHSFGKVYKSKVTLNELGKVAKKCWQEIPIHFPHVDLDEFIIMPNHVHGIVIVNWKNNFDKEKARVETQNLASQKKEKVRVETRHGESQIKRKLGTINKETYHGKSLHKTRIINKHHLPVERNYQNIKKGSVNSIVNQYKGSVTRYAKKHNIPFQWQPRFHDKIIRNEKQLYAVQNYISWNPLNWHKDEYYLS